MKLYSIWWEEEIPLMCSCNDCCRKKKKSEGELPSFHFTWISWKKSKLWKQAFSVFCSSHTPGHSSSSSEPTPTRSLGLTLGISNCFDTPRPAVSRPFDSHKAFRQSTPSVKKNEAWCLSEALAPPKTRERRFRRFLSTVLGTKRFTDSLFGEKKKKDGTRGNTIIHCNYVWQAETGDGVYSERGACYKRTIKFHFQNLKKQDNPFVKLLCLVNICSTTTWSHYSLWWGYVLK